MAKISSNQKNQFKQEILTLVGLEALSIAESKAMTALFGTGVGVAVANQRQSDLIKKSGDLNKSAYEVSKTFVNDYSPDAYPDGKGGFSPSLNSPLWNGRMSSSLIGMPVMCSLKFLAISYLTLDGRTINIPDTTFDTVLITLKKGKNIEKTQVAGRNTGSVKEFISNSDWQINIKIIITASQASTSLIESRNQAGSYPIENMEALSLLLDAPISLQVENWFLNKVAGINYIVIDDGVDISQVEGDYETQRVEIPALSDNPLIIKVTS